MRWILVPLLAWWLVATVPPVAAQAPQFSGDECVAAPRPRAEALALLDGEPTAAPGPLPAGVDPTEPADHPTTEAVAAAYRETLTCLYTGDLLRYLALFSDDYLRRLPAGARAELRAAVAQVPEGTPVADGTGNGVRPNAEVADAWLLGDGRVYAVCLVAWAAPQQVVVVRVVFVRVGDRWLVDDQDRGTTIDIPEQSGGGQEGSPPPRS